MKIKSVGLNRFRSYENHIRFEMVDLCVLVGPNDVGKSTVLEALDIFFNDGRGSIKIDKEDVNKKCLERNENDIEIEVELLYNLFQSDRENNDSDDEVQDPMRIAVKEILSDQAIQEKLMCVAETVRKNLDEVATNTLEKLKELKPAIANSLTAQLPEAGSLKWSDVFRSVAIKMDDDISINKKGSGTKRLILFSFFRAEAERRRNAANLPSVIYAIEEPETSQYPQHHRDLTDALLELSKNANTQVLMTTHSPEIVKQLEFKNLLLVSDNNSGATLKKISNVLDHELPYPSLNEVNFVAFGEGTIEYFNELYGFITENNWIKEYLRDKPKRYYIELFKDGTRKERPCTTIPEYIRHQIHHPENKLNTRYEHAELLECIENMRMFLKTKKSENSNALS